VVTTSRGCAGLELLSEEHLMVAEDPESFALAIIGLLREPARAAALGAAGRQAVLHRYTWEAIARQYEEDVRAFLRI
jgi:glycosyltransferase involved in cell wall biosynthesis